MAVPHVNPRGKSVVGPVEFGVVTENDRSAHLTSDIYWQHGSMVSNRTSEPSTALDDLVKLLDLEPIEVNIFRGQSPDENRQRVFGGQVAGQALVAASRTIDEPRGSAGAGL